MISPPPLRGVGIWLRLNAAGAPPEKTRALAERIGIDEVLGALGAERPELAARAKAFDAEREQELAARHGIRLLVADDPEYPALLKSLPDAPLVLYAWGGSLAGDALAFVGSRRPTPYGRRMTRALVREAAGGPAIVSGLARGIDTEAHRAALAAGGRTWAVLGSGLLSVYPPENEPLARELREAGGCLLSEYPLATNPQPGYFPARNRIVSGLSWGVVVVEGRVRSGSLITAKLAAAQGREVFAVPGPADSPLSEAPHQLIAEGAKLTRSMEDVWPELPPGCRASLLNRKNHPGTPSHPSGGFLNRTLAGAKHENILQSLASETRSIEELAQEQGLDFSAISNILLELELEGLVEALPGQRYAKKGN